jgi:hypothetical protein
MAGLTRWQRGRPGGSTAPEPRLIRYPGTESAPEQTAEATGFHRYWFHLNEDYPSLSVYTFYKQQLESEGWRPVNEGQPQWNRREGKDKSGDLFRATWTSANGLFQLDLEMVSPVQMAQSEGTRTETRQPGLDIFVTMQRTLLPPGIATPLPKPKREPGAPSGPEIQVR